MEIPFAFELPPSADDDEVTLQTLKCPDCAFRGAAVYRESRHGRLDSESWDHEGYSMSPEAFERLDQALTLCPSPSNRRCRCATHLVFADQNWNNPAQLGIDPSRRFSMRWTR
jgi:hypothetical protein